MDYTVHGILRARISEWVARDWTQVSRIAGGFFTNWAAREAQESSGERLSAGTTHHQTAGLRSRIDLVKLRIHSSLRKMWMWQLFNLIESKFLHPQSQVYCKVCNIVKCLSLQPGCPDWAGGPWAIDWIPQIYKEIIILTFYGLFVAFICKMGTIMPCISLVWGWIRWSKCIEKCVVHCNWSINVNCHYY